MSINNTAQTAALIRANLWSNQIKDVLYADLFANKYVRTLSDFPDGNTINIPSIGQLEALDYQEGNPIQYQALDTGNFTFTITNYLQSGTAITNKMKQDSFYMSELVAAFVPKQARAIKERFEADVLKEGQPKTGNPAGYQIASNANLINGASHRLVGSQLVNAKQCVGPADFAKALYALKKANVPQTNLIAIVDPSVEYVLNTLTNLTSVQNNPKWEGIINDGIGSGMKFIKNVYGFDVYTSQYLPLSGQNQTGAVETINTVASTGASVANVFFSATQDVVPYIAAWRQMPKVDAEYNKDLQQDEYVTTARYGVKIWRPENLVTVLSDPSVVS